MKIRNLDDLILLASEREGTCLSKEFTDQMVDHEWRCKKGHTFDLNPYLVSKGAWCRQCDHRKIPEEHLQWLQNYAIERGGKCLSNEFINRSTKIAFECAEGHQWELLPTTIFYDQTWCKKCAGLTPLTLNDLKDQAIERGGECISQKYLGREVKHRWRCSAGHEFEHTPKKIKSGAWCSKCNAENERLESLELMKKWAEERHGKLLSAAYINTASLLEWECENGHQFKKSRDKIKHLTVNDWCSECNNLKRNRKREVERIEEIHRYALEKGGKCFSRSYKNDYTTLKFECAKGHQWETIAHSIIYNHSWCPECNMERLRKGKKTEEKLEEIRQYALEKGGKCLSDSYKNPRTTMKFECAKGHQWETKAENVLHGHTCWCPECNLDRRRLKKK
jgi:hypothetical protein